MSTSFDEGVCYIAILLNIIPNYLELENMYGEMLLWYRRTPQPEANPTQAKIYFFMSWDWFYIENSPQETQPDQILRKDRIWYQP